MDAARLKVLQAELEAQLEKLEQVYVELEDRAAQMNPNAPGYIESTGYQLHNLYNAVEDLFKIVANAFENSVTDLSRWHTELLRRMALDIQGIRPALLSTESAELLNELRAFRHLFRHAYGVQLDASRVEQNLARARKLRSLLPRDVTHFLKQFGE
jgi:uncharacterized protein YutE (UPF0331/DUF86 family)